MKPDRETVDADTVDQLSTGGERVILQIPRAVPTKTLTPLARSNERCHEPGRVTDTVACAALTAPAETRVKISFSVMYWAIFAIPFRRIVLRFSVFVKQKFL